MEPTSAESLAIWNRIAGWWDGVLGEGNEFQRELIMPSTDRLLAIQPGESVLDACCGNGNYSRRLVVQGAKVIAFDGAAPFIEAAKKRSPENSIEYHVIDATSAFDLEKIPSRTFDAAVCSMALMDLPTITPLLESVFRSLKANGRFVLSIPHPCFNSNRTKMTAELITDQGQMRQNYGISISHYITPFTEPSSGLLNQPEPHFIFHRPIKEWVNAFTAVGFVIDAIDEPTFTEPAKNTNTFSWKKRSEIPPVMLFRLVAR